MGRGSSMAASIVCRIGLFCIVMGLVFIPLGLWTSSEWAFLSLNQSLLLVAVGGVLMFVGRDSLPTLWREFLGQVSKDGSIETELEQARELASRKGVRAGPVLAGLLLLAASGFLLYLGEASSLLIVFCCFSVGLSIICFRSAFLLPAEGKKQKTAQRLLNVTLGLGLSLVIYYGALLSLFNGST